ncbi:MAG: 2,4-dienoyl-CoA reductase-like NADH-dependent reductase (Old Yellow Enzyme family) [Bermanella sp.]|jgi:2,4-dienoyl-CoA reductase-like NADH-dependent reductase (Old Yellow Enzyme family)|uniref:NADH:flavin oxidoreductase/NADH oxidase family protein n=1 Tax=uncultured Paraglaciecola sp. TaxID=1765024 RepID=UPI0025E5EE4F|nr:NADH:flavin oxidoreductase/NADH oxidase family protein [uncultured Paraglaciecola sp.]
MTSPLASSISLPNGSVLPNRLCKSAMTEGLADKFDLPTAELIQLYKTWALGGTGLHITGNIMVDRRYLERAGNVVLEDDKNIELFRSWSKQGTAGGNHLWVQLNHPGRQCPRMVSKTPLCPSDVQLTILGNFSRPRPMDQSDIEEVIARFITSARLVKEAGFTGVQIHCAHGYLLSQFLSPKINQRQDQWGGTLENRARIIRRIIVGVRKVVGTDFPIGVKLNSADFQKGGFSLEDCITVAKWLGEDSVDLLEISGGTYEQLSLIGVEPTDVRESTRKREAYFIEYAERIKQSAKIPVMITGGFRSRVVMERAIESGEVDVIGLARPLCTDPDCSAKLINQTIQSIDSHEDKLVLGQGFWGNNSPSSLIKAINSFGQVGFYYWQIIRLSRGLAPETQLGTFKAFLRHMTNDFKLNIKRKFG